MTDLLRYEAVTVSYGGTPVVCDVGFAVQPGELVCLVGPSGCGKSTLMKAAMGLLGPGGAVTSGRILYAGQNLPDLPPKALRRFCGAELGYVFQDAGASFCPVRRIGPQLYEVMTAHAKLTRQECEARARELLARLGLADGARILRSYPFELSGGMQQRVAIAAALLPGPRLLFADEPTSALDGDTRRQVMQELQLARELYGTAIVLATHDGELVQACADQVMELPAASQQLPCGGVACREGS